VSLDIFSTNRDEVEMSLDISTLRIPTSRIASNFYCDRAKEASCPASSITSSYIARRVSAVEGKWLQGEKH
jgi:hypothetical protein